MEEKEVQEEKLPLTVERVLNYMLYLQEDLEDVELQVIYLFLSLDSNMSDEDIEVLSKIEDGLSVISGLSTFDEEELPDDFDERFDFIYEELDTCCYDFDKYMIFLVLDGVLGRNKKRFVAKYLREEGDEDEKEKILNILEYFCESERELERIKNSSMNYNEASKEIEKLDFKRLKLIDEDLLKEDYWIISNAKRISDII